MKTRAEVLAMSMPVERRFVRGVVYRYATEEDANNHLKEEARVMRDEELRKRFAPTVPR